MKINMFSACRTLDELKKAYRKAAFASHPDHGGSTEEMQRVNADYESRFDEIKRGIGTAGADEKQQARDRKTTEAPREFMEIVEKLLKLDGIEIELCGSWLWISGNTYPHKDALKACGCKWSHNKRMWYWRHEEDDCYWSHGTTSMSKIRSMYGSQIIDAAGRERSRYAEIPAEA